MGLPFVIAATVALPRVIYHDVRRFEDEKLEKLYRWVDLSVKSERKSRTVTETVPTRLPKSTLPWYIPLPPNGVFSQVAGIAVPPTRTVTVAVLTRRAEKKILSLLRRAGLTAN